MDVGCRKDSIEDDGEDEEEKIWEEEQFGKGLGKRMDDGSSRGVSTGGVPVVQSVPQQMFIYPTTARYSPLQSISGSPSIGGAIGASQGLSIISQNAEICWKSIGDYTRKFQARPLLSRALDGEEFESLVDQRLEKNYVESEMLQMIGIAAACVRHSSAKRPQMGQVVRAFDALATPDLMNGMRVGDSEVFNSAQQSAEIRWFRRMEFGSQDFSTDFFSQDSLNG